MSTQDGTLALSSKRVFPEAERFVDRPQQPNRAVNTTHQGKPIVLAEITNNPRPYAWGSVTAIADLLGVPPTGEPQAELWLGAHPGSPSVDVATGAPLTVRYPAGLPFLLKILAAASPLSLQAHPTMAQAVEGFARENAAGIPVESPTRNYKDALHKPEAIVALTDGFQALCGFRSVEAARSTLATLIADPLTPPAAALSVTEFVKRLDTDSSLPGVFEWLISGGARADAEVTRLVAALVEFAQRGGSLPGVAGEHWRVIDLLATHYPGDAGIAISLLLNVVTLTAGEALFLPAGNIHSYLGGLGVEIMASSVNVLRGGLTPKHVDVDELLSVLDFEPVAIPYLVPESVVDGVSIFDPGIGDFRLTVVTEGATVQLAGPAIALCTAGSFTLTDASVGQATEIRRGQSFLADRMATLEIVGSGQLFLATTGRTPR
jgi:mannose-6-phosphate isomerase